MAEQHDYFFMLYIVGFCAEGWLAILALLHYPSDEHLEALSDDPNMLMYEVGCLAYHSMYLERVACSDSTIDVGWQCALHVL